MKRMTLKQTSIPSMLAAFSVLVAGFFAQCMRAQGQDARWDVGPFEAVRWVDEARLEVQVQDTWYQLIAVNGLTLADLLAYASEKHAGRSQHRITEDLVELMGEMGTPPSSQRVHLSVRRLDTGEELALLNIPMKRANRAAVVQANRMADLESLPRVEREHVNLIDPRYDHLVTRINEGMFHGSVMLSSHQARQDLDELEWRLKDQFSYLTLRDVDLEAAFDTLRARLGDEVRLDDFVIQLQKLIALFGDGHARLEQADFYRPRGWTPFRFGASGDRIVAYAIDRSEFVDADHPYVVSINGVEIERWVEQAGESVPHGSPQWVRHRAVSDLRWFIYLCRELDVDLNQVTVELEPEDRTSTKTLTFDVFEQYPEAEQSIWPMKDDARLPGDIGYLRIEEMDDDLIPGLHDAMKSFADTKALIIDLRGNGGGSRGIIAEMLPYFMGPDAGPLVVNAAKYRLGADFGQDHLLSRHLYPAHHERWDDLDRASMLVFHEGFKPAWLPPDEDFSEWHYFIVLPRIEGGQAVPYYTNPVYVLMDNGCFSATDIFLGALDLMEQIVLIGEPSGGGSGRVESFTLAHSDVKVTVSSMASFRPGGETYDLNGIAPDVVVEVDAGWFNGDSDPQLDTVLKMIGK